MKIKEVSSFSGWIVEVIEDDGSLKTYERYGSRSWKEVRGNAAYDVHESEAFELEAAYHEYVMAFSCRPSPNTAG